MQPGSPTMPHSARTAHSGSPVQEDEREHLSALTACFTHHRKGDPLAFLHQKRPTRITYDPTTGPEGSLVCHYQVAPCTPFAWHLELFAFFMTRFGLAFCQIKSVKHSRSLDDQR